MSVNNTTSLSRITYRLILLVLVSFILIYAKDLLIPFAWALVVSLASMNLVTGIHEKTRMPLGLVIMLYLIALSAIFVAVFFFFYIELQALVSDLGQMQDRLSGIMHELSLRLKDMGIAVPDHYDPAYFKALVSEHNDLIIGMLGSVGSNIFDFLLTIFYIFFLLYYKDALILFAERKFKDEASLAQFKKLVINTLTISQQYIVGMALLGVMTSVVCYFILLVLGVKSAYFFAIFFGFLSLIPVVGVPAGMVVIALFTLITIDSVMVTVYVSIALLLLNFLQDNVFRPWVMGTKMEVNAFAIFFFVILGGFFWGVSGMVLFIPFASVIKILLDQSQNGSHYSVFLSELPKKPKKHSVKKQIVSE